MAAKNSPGILHRRRLAEVRAAECEEAAKALSVELEAEMAPDNAPWTAARLMYLHDVIKPEETRQAVVNGLFIACGCKAG